MQSKFHDEEEFMFGLELLVHLRVVTYPRADIPMLLEGQFGIDDGFVGDVMSKMQEIQS